MSIPHYTYNEKLILNSGGHQYHIPKIGVAVQKSGDHLILHKHGFPEKVKQWQLVAKTVFPDIIYVEIEPEGYQEVNKMISTTGYTPECLKWLLT